MSSTAAPAPADSAASTSVFGDIWDTINPLQHIPIVSSLYRMATGESITPEADILGSTIYGGPIGGAIATVSEIGSSIGHAIFGGGSTTQTAAAAPSPAVASAQIEPAAGAAKFHATTNDWLNQALGNKNSASASTASSSYKKIQAATADWLNSYPKPTATA